MEPLILNPLAATRLKLLLDEAQGEIADDGGTTGSNYNRENGIQADAFIRLAAELLDWPVDIEEESLDRMSFQRDVISEVATSLTTLLSLKVCQAACCTT